MMAKFIGITKKVKIDGYLSPFYLDDQPFLAQFEGSFFVLVFSTEEKLREQMRFLAPGEEYKIKKIEEQKEFCESIWEHGVRIMLDPRPDLQANKTRWTEILRDTLGLN